VRLEDIEEGKRLLAEHERAYDSIADHSEGSKAREEAVLLAHDLCIDLQGWIFDNAPDLLAAAEAAASERARADKAEAEVARLRKANDAALSAFRTWLDANGLVIVPRESTLEMDEVGLKEIQMAHNDGISVDAEVMWALMIAAAPDPLEPDKP
jgi:hypothetical protein